MLVALCQAPEFLLSLPVSEVTESGNPSLATVYVYVMMRNSSWILKTACLRLYFCCLVVQEQARDHCAQCREGVLVVWQ